MYNKSSEVLRIDPDKLNLVLRSESTGNNFNIDFEVALCIYIRKILDQTDFFCKKRNI